MGIAPKFARKYGLTDNEAKDLLDLLLMDVVFHGAIQEPTKTPLDSEDLEMIFYSPFRKLVARCKTGKEAASILGWLPRTKKNGNYFSNGRLRRIVAALGGVSNDEAYKIAEDYFTILTENNILKRQKTRAREDSFQPRILLFPYHQKAICLYAKLAQSNDYEF